MEERGNGGEQGPIRKITDDILAELFEFSFVIQHRAPFVVSQVCRRWRAVALRLPSLWSEIEVRTEKDRTFILPLCLKRSSARAIDIELAYYCPRCEWLHDCSLYDMDCNEDERDEGLPENLKRTNLPERCTCCIPEAIFAATNRIRCLDMSSTLYRSLRNSVWSGLVCLSLDVWRKGDQILPFGVLSASTFPKLQYFNARYNLLGGDANDPDWLPPPLKALIIGADRDGCWRRLLKGCAQSLEALRVRYPYSIEEEDQRSREALKLPQLQSLMVTSRLHPSPNATVFEAATPRLRYLSMEGRGGSDLLSSSLAKVDDHNLVLLRTSERGNLSAYPLLRTLQLLGTNDLVYHSLEQLERDQTLCPNLGTIEHYTSNHSLYGKEDIGRRIVNLTVSRKINVSYIRHQYGDLATWNTGVEQIETTIGASRDNSDDDISLPILSGT